MKILLSFMNGLRDGADPSIMPCFYEAFSEGLKQAGNDLLIYHVYGNKQENHASLKRLYQQVDSFAPELIIAFNNWGPDWATRYDCPIAVYEVDSPLLYGNVETLRRRPDRYVYFVLQDESREILRRDFGVPDQHIIETRHFTAVRAQNVPFQRNIVFIGSRFLSPASGNGYVWDRFRRDHLSPEQLADFRKLVSAVWQNPFESPEFLQELCPSIEVTSALILTIVSSLSAAKRFEMLSEIAPLGIELFGTKDWIDGSNSNMELSLSYNPQKIFSVDDNQQLYNSSKLCVNINHCQATSSFSWRVYDIMASCGCLVAEDRPDLKKLFPKIQLPVFSNKFELMEVCRDLLRDEKRRRSVVMACNAAMDESCRFKHILEILEAGLSLKVQRGEAQGSISYCCSPLDKKRRHRLSLVLQCLKLATTQIPGCGRLFNKNHCVKRIVNYTDYQI